MLDTIDITGKLGVDYQVSWLKNQGINNIIRYISRGGGAKCVNEVEVNRFIDNGFTVGIVYEFWGGASGLPGSIDATNGAEDGKYAFEFLQNIGVPQYTVVYFAVDTDVTNNPDINTYVIPYLQAAKAELKGYYRSGIYGCGSSCAAGLTTAGVDKAWLANAIGWTGYNAFLSQKRATILQEKGNNLYDPDSILDADWGGFSTLNAVS